MGKSFAYRRADGGVSVVTFVSDEPTAEELAAAIPEGAAVIENPELPDRTFRNAWGIADGVVAVDMPKAREIHMGRIRAARDKKLANLDVEQLKGNDVATEKQRLRDIPQTFDLTAAATPEALDALWPEGLER